MSGRPDLCKHGTDHSLATFCKYCDADELAAHEPAKVEAAAEDLAEMIVTEHDRQGLTEGQRAARLAIASEMVTQSTPRPCKHGHEAHVGPYDLGGPDDRPAFNVYCDVEDEDPPCWSWPVASTTAEAVRLWNEGSR